VSSPILRTAARVLIPLLHLFAVYLFLRGHDAPGGGFVAGLVTSVAFVLLMFSDGVAVARRAALVRPRFLLGAGLLTALGTAIVPVVRGDPLLTSYWVTVPTTSVALGTPILFDLGVALVVVGVALTMIFPMAEE
jgi:multicomponent Na+:H+ antiporter subunit B